MTNQVFEGFQLESKFIHLENNGNIIDKINTGRSHWEVHPDGDELLYLLSGSMDVVIESEGKNKVITLASFSSCIVPKETWHQTIAREPCSLPFITPGKDTQHRE